MMLTVALVVLVIFLFLRSLSATVIPSIAVPLSLVGTFGVMYLLGYSLNNLSLMALTISTGFVAPGTPRLRRKVLVKLQQQIEEPGISDQGLVQEGSPSVSSNERREPLGAGVKPTRGASTKLRLRALRRG